MIINICKQNTYFEQKLFSCLMLPKNPLQSFRIEWKCIIEATKLEKASAIAIIYNLSLTLLDGLNEIEYEIQGYFNFSQHRMNFSTSIVYTWLLNHTQIGFGLCSKLITIPCYHSFKFMIWEITYNVFYSFTNNYFN